MSCSFQTNHEGTPFSVSAVMAVYNPKPEFFRQAVLSVLGQTMPVLELVLVNDGGSDEFKSVLPDDDRIRVFTKPNEGVAATRNFAIKQCRGEYIAFLDQDDYWYSDKLAEQMAMISVKGEACMVISPGDIVDNQGVPIIKQNRKKVTNRYFRKIAHPDIRFPLADGNFIYSSTPLIHRRVFECVGLFDSFTQPHDDWDMYLRIALAGISVHCYRERALSVWRMHDSNESQKRMAMMLSKCEVEWKILQGGVPEPVAKIMHSNLALDQIVMDNLWYNEREFARFRETVRRDLPGLMRCAVNSGRHDRYVTGYRKRAASAIIKSARRYLLSLFSRQR